MKNVVLAQIADIYGRSRAILVNNNSTYESIIKCADLSSYWPTYAKKLTPYEYVVKNGTTYTNSSSTYDVFSGINGLFEELLSNKNGEAISRLLVELAKRISNVWISDSMSDFDNLSRLYKTVGLLLKFQDEHIEVQPYTKKTYIDEESLLEKWMSEKHPDVMEAYEAAIESYKKGHAGACIESCRTAIVTLFEKYKGIEPYAKWIRGCYTLSGDDNSATIDELNKALKKDLNQNDVADFFIENRGGKLTKTKAIYAIYSMMSDYGTHRGEGSIESPQLNDALMSLRFTEAIMLWIAEMHN